MSLLARPCSPAHRSPTTSARSYASRFSGLFALLAGLSAAGTAFAQPSAPTQTPGFPELVVHWKVLGGQTCEDISKAMYGSTRHVNLLHRYNNVRCGAPLAEGPTLVLPAKVSTVQSATLRSVHPQANARAPGAAWSQAASGMPLFTNSNINTLDKGRAGIEFVDRSRVFMAENTLVIIYNTASQSRVSKTPPAMQLERGEIKAGLSALRGEPIGIDANAGRINVVTGECVVRQKGDVTSVTVLKGKSTVTSGGVTVDVTEKSGTSFVRAKPPAPPRPLPPPPEWASSGSEDIWLAPNGKRSFEVTWREVAQAARYRLEVARDNSFHDFAVRTEILKGTTKFEVEPLPQGSYAMTLSTVDAQDYLGVQSSKRFVHLVSATLEGAGGAVLPNKVTANPYGSLKLAVPPAVEVWMDGRAVAANEVEIDFTKRRPSQLELRARGGTTKTTVLVDYTKVKGELSYAVGADGKGLEVQARFSGLDGIEVAGRVAPRARVHLPGGVREVPLAARGGGLFAATVKADALPAKFAVDVVDGRGELLGSTEANGPPPPPDEVEAPPPPTGSVPRIGVTLPPMHVSAITSVAWWSPTAPDAAGLGAVAGSAVGEGSWHLQASAWASGAIGPFGVDARIGSNAVEERARTDSAAWLGARWRAYRNGLARVEVGPAVRVGLPLTAESPPWRIEPALAVGGVAGRVTWLGNLGARVRLVDDSSRPDVPFVSGFVLAGGTVDLLTWLRAQAVLDAHVLSDPRVRGGLALGLEAGEVVFASLAARVSPWSDSSGVFSGQLAVGLRAWEP